MIIKLLNNFTSKHIKIVCIYAYIIYRFKYQSTIKINAFIHVAKVVLVMNFVQLLWKLKRTIEILQKIM